MAHEMDQKALSAVQQTLRHLMLALAGASKADLPTLADLLAAATKEKGLCDESRLMLEDLALGAAAMAKLFQPPGSEH